MSDAAALAARAELADLWAAGRRQMSWRGVTGKVTVKVVTGEQGRALTQLLGRRKPWLAGDSAIVDMAALDEALGHVDGLAAVLEAHGGPVIDRRAKRDARGAQVDTMWRELQLHPAARQDPVARWLADQRSSGRWHGPTADLEVACRVLSDCLAIAECLPVQTEVGIPKLAADVLGDPHALDADDSHPAGRAVLGLLEALTGETGLTGAARRRALWAAAGVRVGSIEPARCLGLRPSGTGLLARQLRERADAGWPQLVTSVELAAEPLRISGIVHLCENREIYEAALSQLGPNCPQLLCVDGWPSSTVTLLMDHIAPGQAMHHGDYDWGGWRIFEHMRTRHGARPWRYDAAEFVSARARHPDAGRPLNGTPPPPEDWDDLAAALAADGRGISEELELELLIDDLRSASGPA
jgi:uncharacterized protein (TIGR02679 family)